MILFLKRLNIIIALILIFIALGLIKFKNNLTYLKTESYNVDAIVVLTGGKGERIKEGYNHVKNSKQNKLFISGVDNTFNSEVVLVNILNFDPKTVECCIEVGYLSSNTYENALETRYWALEKKITSILLITSNLHMQRAHFLFEQLSGLEVTPYAIDIDDGIIPLEKMVEEYIKLLISKIIFIKKYEI
tara:strand:- start:1542 stop:2108 length:567 start_codon:yes stop_codon:yes gene_type:complete